MLIEIYTDGACSNNPGPGGYGAVIIFDKQIRKEISGGYEHTTNNRMELIAVIKSLEMLANFIRPENNHEIILYSDSKYIVDSINKNWLINWRENNWCNSSNKKILNIDLWEVILDLVALYNIKFIWVKGHNDNEENEYCDLLARQAMFKQELEVDKDYVKKS